MQTCVMWSINMILFFIYFFFALYIRLNLFCYWILFWLYILGGIFNVGGLIWAISIFYVKYFKWFQSAFFMRKLKLWWRVWLYNFCTCFLYNHWGVSKNVNKYFRFSIFWLLEVKLWNLTFEFLVGSYFHFGSFYFDT